MFLNFDDTMGYPLTETDEIEHIICVIMEQDYSFIAGLKRFCRKGEHVVSSELNQIHDMETFTPVDVSKISKNDWE